MKARRTESRLLALVASVALCGTLFAAGATPSSAAPLDAPTNLQASGDGMKTLSWDWMRGATGYTVQASTNSSFSGTLLVNTSTANVSYTPTAQFPPGTIWWHVQAKYPSGTSAFSEDSFTQPSPAYPTQLDPSGNPTLVAPEQPLVLKWNAVPKAVSYDVQVTDDPQFGRIISTTNVKTNTLTFTNSLPARGTYYWRVQARFSGGVVSGYPDPSLAGSYTISSHDATTNPPVAPTSATTDSEPVVQDIALAWPSVPGAATYTLQVSRDQNFLDSTANIATVSNIRGTRYSPPTSWGNDQYFWRVQGIDAGGNPLGWWPKTTGLWQFQRNWPDNVIPQWPANGATISDQAQLFLQWKPVKHASRYTILTSASPTFSPSQTCTTTNTTFTPYWTASGSAQCVPAASGTFYWQVIAWDDSTSNSSIRTEPARSPVMHFTYSPSVPDNTLARDTPVESGIVGALGGVQLTAGATCNAIEGNCHLPATPVLTWPAVVGADGYAVWVSADQPLSNLYPSGLQIVTKGNIWTLPSELADSQAHTAYWIAVKACAKDTHGSCLNTFASGAAPAQFNVLSAPVHLCSVVTAHDGSPDQNPVCPPNDSPDLYGQYPSGTGPSPSDSLTTNDNVTFDWSDYLDTTKDDGGGTTNGPGVEARYYHVQTSTSSDFSSTLDDVKVDQTTFTSFNTTYPDGPIYWRVQAYDGSGNPLRWSDIGTFDKRSAAPTPTAPVGGAATQPATVLEWTPTENTKSYNIQVYKDDGAPFGPSNQVLSTNTLQSKYSFTSPLQAGKYVWRVQRVDSMGRLSKWSADNSTDAAGFTVKNPTFDVSAPATGAQLSPGNYTFTWADPDAMDAVNYRFEKRPASGSGTETATTAATTWSPTSLPANNTSWQWRVVPMDSAGHDLPASPWRDFTFVSMPTAPELPVQGSPQVGSTLKAIEPAWSLGGVTTSFQWYYGSARAGNEIPVQNNAPELFSPAVGDVGKTVLVVATGTKDGYNDGSVTSTSYKITKGAAPTLAQSLVLDGSGQVGTKLSGAPVWTRDDVVTAYQWQRDGRAISGATTSSYLVSADDYGHTLALQVTGTVTGYENGVATSAPVAVKAGSSLVATTRPHISGTPAAGQRLSTDRGSWQNSPTGFTYQWTRDGAYIVGATASTYTVGKYDIGRVIGITVTASRTGYADGRASSSVRIAKARASVATSLSRTTITVKTRAKLRITVSAPPLTVVSGKLEVLVDGRVRIRSTVPTSRTRTVTLPKLPKGRHKIKVRYLGNSQASAATSAQRILTVKKR